MIDQYPSANGVLTSLIWRKTMSGGETSLSGYDNASQALSYTPGQEQVYLNGILLVRGDDYTATNGTSITGLSALSSGDFVQVNCYNNFSVATTPATSITGTIANNQLANSAITINGSATSLGGTYTNASASTSSAGIVQLSDSTSTTSSILAATPTAVKSAYDLAAAAIPKNLTTTTGDIIYASGANTPARLGIGSSNQLLRVSSGGVPEWATVSGGGWTLLGTMTLNQQTNTFSNISQSYNSLYVAIVNGSQSQNGIIYIKPNNNSSGFRYSGHYYDNATLGHSYTHDGSYIGLAGAAVSAYSNVYGAFMMHNYTSTYPKMFFSFGRGQDQTGTKTNVFNTGFDDNAQAITSIVIRWENTGTGGTAYLYGIV